MAAPSPATFLFSFVSICFFVLKNGKRPVSQSFSGILAADRGRSANSRGESQENWSDEGPIVLSSLEFQKRSVPTDYLDSGQFLCVINKSQPTRIANRIQRIMDRTVSQEQAAFIREKNLRSSLKKLSTQPTLGDRETGST